MGTKTPVMSIHNLLTRALVRAPVALALATLLVLGGDALGQATSSVVMASATAEDVEKMSAQDMVSRSDRLVNKMEEMLSQSFKLLEEAISEGEVSVITARNEAITAMKSLVKLSEENFLTLQQKSAEGNREAVEHEYVKITIAASKMGELYSQVQTAGGIKVDLEATDVEVQMEVDSQMAPALELSTPPTAAEAPPVIPDPPVYASAYK